MGLHSPEFFRGHKDSAAESGAPGGVSLLLWPLCANSATCCAPMRGLDVGSVTVTGDRGGVMCASVTISSSAEGGGASSPKLGRNRTLFRLACGLTVLGKGPLPTGVTLTLVALPQLLLCL